MAIDYAMRRDARRVNDRIERLTNELNNSTYFRRLTQQLPRRDADWVAIRSTARDLLEELKRLKRIQKRVLEETGFVFSN